MCQTDGCRKLGYFKWWVKSNEWWVTKIEWRVVSDEWWVMKKKKTKQPLNLFDFFFFFSCLKLRFICSISLVEEVLWRRMRNEQQSCFSINLLPRKDDHTILFRWIFFFNCWIYFSLHHSRCYSFSCLE